MGGPVERVDSSRARAGGGQSDLICWEVSVFVPLQIFFTIYLLFLVFWVFGLLFVFGPPF